MAGKSHRKAKTGRKAEKRKAADKKKKGLSDKELADAKARNPKAFTYQSAGRAKAQLARSADKEQRRLHGALAGHFVLPRGCAANCLPGRRCSS